MPWHILIVLYDLHIHFPSEGIRFCQFASASVFFTLWVEFSFRFFTKTEVGMSRDFYYNPGSVLVLILLSHFFHGFFSRRDHRLLGLFCERSSFIPVLLCLFEIWKISARAELNAYGWKHCGPRCQLFHYEVPVCQRVWNFESQTNRKSWMRKFGLIFKGRWCCQEHVMDKPEETCVSAVAIKIRRNARCRLKEWIPVAGITVIVNFTFRKSRAET